MRALVLAAPQRLVVEERPAPVPEPGHALLKVGAVGICGSDLHGYTGETGRRVPGMVMGHEIGAVIESISGPGPTEGSTVAVQPVISCGECPACRSGCTNLCPRIAVIGVTPSLQGGFADYISVPVANLIPMPSVSVEQAALVEPLAVGLHAVRRAGVRAGDSVFIAGAGAIGVACLLAARRDGAERVFVSDTIATRRDTAAALGATALDPSKSDVVEQLAEHGVRSVRCALDAVGISPTLESALAVTEPGGTIVIVGMGSPRVDLNLFAMVASERAVYGSYCYTEPHFREAAEWVDSGDADLSGLVQRRAGWDGIAGLFHRLAVREDDAIKGLFVAAS